MTELEDLIKKAKEGDAEAQYELGVFYRSGSGIKKSYDKFLKCWEKSANQGYQSALYNLVVAYYLGDGVKKSIQKAIYWWNKANGKEDPEAEQNVVLFIANIFKSLKNQGFFDEVRKYKKH